MEKILPIKLSLEKKVMVNQILKLIVKSIVPQMICAERGKKNEV